MPLSDFLKPEGVIAALRVNSKKQALQELAEHPSGGGRRAFFSVGQY